MPTAQELPIAVQMQQFQLNHSNGMQLSPEGHISTHSNQTPPDDDRENSYYLKNFRVNQCQLFLQHKCNQHRPFTCFAWHFRNQRRRKSVLLENGQFSYSPDIYCTDYNETTGDCPRNDECPYLHRNTNDTERRYHLRYYKTSICIHETDSKTGNCMKNGVHCAFAHGKDLRQPIYPDGSLDSGVHNLSLSQSLENLPSLSTSPVEQTNPLEMIAHEICREKIIPDDSRWDDANFVLLHYKTDSCPKPPRLCRQGYACPFFHNTRDKRRSPKIYKYKSTACPTVKIGQEWKDPSQCKSKEECEFCHTRTEQQFHPDIYKSNRCNDMIQTGYCPRGAFCAFAHVQPVNSKTTAPAVKSDFSSIVADAGSIEIPSALPYQRQKHPYQLSGRSRVVSEPNLLQNIKDFKERKAQMARHPFQQSLISEDTLQPMLEKQPQIRRPSFGTTQTRQFIVSARQKVHSECWDRPNLGSELPNFVDDIFPESHHPKYLDQITRQKPSISPENRVEKHPFDSQKRVAHDPTMIPFRGRNKSALGIGLDLSMQQARAQSHTSRDIWIDKRHQSNSDMFPFDKAPGGKSPAGDFQPAGQSIFDPIDKDFGFSLSFPKQGKDHSSEDSIPVNENVPVKPKTLNNLDGNNTNIVIQAEMPTAVEVRKNDEPSSDHQSLESILCEVKHKLNAKSREAAELTRKLEMLHTQNARHLHCIAPECDLEKLSRVQLRSLHKKLQDDTQKVEKALFDHEPSPTNEMPRSSSTGASDFQQSGFYKQYSGSNLINLTSLQQGHMAYPADLVTPVFNDSTIHQSQGSLDGIERRGRVMPVSANSNHTHETNSSHHTIETIFNHQSRQQISTSNPPPGITGDENPSS